LKWIISDIS